MIKACFLSFCLPASVCLAALCMFQMPVWFFFSGEGVKMRPELCQDSSGNNRVDAERQGK